MQIKQMFDYTHACVLRNRAVWLIQLHPRMADFIKQAPIIVPVSMTYQVKDVERIIPGICRDGVKLGGFLDLLHINRGLRHADARAFRTNHANMFKMLKDCDVPMIAQQIAGRTVHQQHELWEQLTTFRAAASVTSKEHLRYWALKFFAERIPVGDHNMRHMLDFFNAQRTPLNLKPNAKWRDFELLVKRWEDEFAKAKRLEEEKYNRPLSPFTAELPVEWEDKPTGIKFLLLNTENDLREEGAVMHHCVGGYHSYVASGTSAIYSARQKDGKRCGTLQLGVRLAPEPLMERVRAYRRPVRDQILRAAIADGSMDLNAAVDTEEVWEMRAVGMQNVRIFNQQQYLTYHNGQPTELAKQAGQRFLHACFKTAPGKGVASAKDEYVDPNRLYNAASRALENIVCNRINGYTSQDVELFRNGIRTRSLVFERREHEHRTVAFANGMTYSVEIMK